ncbi:MAG: hypothetical protein NTX13_21585 [Acidobacteria bacterium]|jgi:hypothetical protein|nr:hypothetical protein [Acidobacteriota bacterium]
MAEFVSLFDSIPDPEGHPLTVPPPPAVQSIDLSRFNRIFEAEQAPAPTFGEVPDGRYRVLITDLELSLASTGNAVLKYGLRVVAGPFERRMVWKRRAITANTIRYTKSELLTCGLRLERLSDLNRRLAELQGIGLEVSKVTKGDKSDVFFNRRLATL